VEGVGTGAKALVDLLTFDRAVNAEGVVPGVGREDVSVVGAGSVEARPNLDFFGAAFRGDLELQGGLKVVHGTAVLGPSDAQVERVRFVDQGRLVQPADDEGVRANRAPLVGAGD